MKINISQKIEALEDLFPGIKPDDAASMVKILLILSNKDSLNSAFNRVRNNGSIATEFIPHSIADARRQWAAHRIMERRLSFSPEKRAEENAKAAARMRQLRARKPSNDPA